MDAFDNHLRLGENSVADVHDIFGREVIRFHIDVFDFAMKTRTINILKGDSIMRRCYLGYVHSRNIMTSVQE